MSEKETTPTTTTEEALDSTAPPTSKKLPADIFSDKLPKDEILPLDDAVEEKPYAVLPDIIQQPSASLNGAPAEDTGLPAAPEQQQEVPMTPAEEAQMAVQTVDWALKGYDKLHALGRYMGKIDMDKLTALHEDGKLNLKKELPIGKKTITVGRFFEEYNEEIDKNIVVTDDFKNAFRPPAIRVAIKRKWFIKDEAACLMLLGEDIISKTAMLIGLKTSINLVLSSLINKKKAKPAEGSTPPATWDTPDKKGDGEEWKEVSEEEDARIATD